MKDVLLYDTSLRDGCQAEDVSFTLEDKLRFLDDQWLQKAAAAGIDGKAALSELKSTVNGYRP